MQVLLHMASALNMPIPWSAADNLFGSLSGDLRIRQQRIAEITEMIHVINHWNLSLHHYLRILIPILFIIYFFWVKMSPTS